MNNRLLTDEKISERWHYFEHIGKGHQSWHSRLRTLRGIAKDQLDKDLEWEAETASIKDVEFAKEKAEFGLSVNEAAHALCEARMVQIWEEIRKRLEMVKQELCFGGDWEGAKETIGRIQALKSRRSEVKE